MHMIATVILLITVNGLSGSASPWQRLSRRTSVRAALANKQDPNFWPTRGRRSDPTLRQASDEEGPFWANRGRSLDDWPIEPPLWTMRSTDEAGPPFWANRGRSTEDQAGPFWANRGRDLSSSEQGPFWANRGRSIEEKTPHRLQRNILYAEEPRWVELNGNARRSAARSGEDAADTFWITRGKRQEMCRNHEKMNKPCRQRSAA